MPFDPPDFSDSLARPVWSALNGPQSALAQRHGEAVRIDPRYGPFGAARDQSEAAQADLAAIIHASPHPIWVVEPEEWPAPPGTKATRVAPIVQMCASSDAETPYNADGIVPLGAEDVPQMTELALATAPGPWGELTHNYAQFYGIFDGDTLAAMAGERLRPAPGFAEVSGVCTWPQYRGEGMAGRLSAHIVAQQRARGDTPFLHAYPGNTAAVELYRGLGFEITREMVVTVLEVDN